MRYIVNVLTIILLIMLIIDLWDDTKKEVLKHIKTINTILKSILVIEITCICGVIIAYIMLLNI